MRRLIYKGLKQGRNHRLISKSKLYLLLWYSLQAPKLNCKKCLFHRMKRILRILTRNRRSIWTGIVNKACTVWLLKIILKGALSTLTQRISIIFKRKARIISPKEIWIYQMQGSVSYKIITCHRNTSKSLKISKRRKKFTHFKRNKRIWFLDPPRKLPCSYKILKFKNRASRDLLNH